MLAFITSIRHPQNCFSYETVLTLLERSLRSVCAQTCDDFFVIVVCNRIPRLDFDDVRVHFVEVDFPPPNAGGSPYSTSDELRADRGSKYLVGLAAARQYAPSHVFFFDCDDFVSNRIVEFVRTAPDGAGWYVRDGYIYQSGSEDAHVLADFHKRCGTSFIVKTALLDPGGDLPSPLTLTSIRESYGDQLILRRLGSHYFLPGELAAHGHALAPLPFRAAIYHIGHNENWTAHTLAENESEKVAVASLLAEFGVTPTLPTVLSLDQSRQLAWRRLVRRPLVVSALAKPRAAIRHLRRLMRTIRIVGTVRVSGR